MVKRFLILLFAISICFNTASPSAFAEESSADVVAKYMMYDDLGLNEPDNSKYPIIGINNAGFTNLSLYGKNYATRNGKIYMADGVASQLGTKYTLEMWINPENDKTNAFLCSTTDSSNASLRCFWFMQNGERLQFQKTYKSNENDSVITITYVSAESIIALGRKAGKEYLNEWHHFVFSYDEDTKEISSYYDGSKLNFNMNSNNYDLSQYTPTRAADYELFVNSLGKMHESRYRVGQMCFYTGALSEEDITNNYNEGMKRYGREYDVTLKQGDKQFSVNEFDVLDESKPVEWYINSEMNESVNTESAYIYNIAENKREASELNRISDSQFTLFSNLKFGEYKLVLAKDIKNSSGVQMRMYDFELPFKVNENTDFRNTLRQNIINCCRDTDDYTAFEELLKENKDFLGIDFSDYNRCIGKQNVLKGLAEEFAGKDFTFEEIAQAFSERATNQLSVDFVDAVKKMNGVLSSAQININEFENLLDEYAVCFDLSEEVKAKYKAAGNQKVADKLSGKSYSENLSDINESIAQFRKDFETAIFETEEDNLYEKISSSDIEELESLLNELYEVYKAPIDMNNDDYALYKEDILKSLQGRKIDKTTLQKDFYTAIFIACLNNTESGNRGKIEKAIESYGKYADIPDEYVKSKYKEDVHKLMIGKKYTWDNLNSVIISACNEAKRLNEKTGGGGNGGGKNNSSNGTNNGGFVISGTGTAASDKDKNNVITQPEKTQYKDVPKTHWANKAITFLSEKAVICGRDDGIFSPDDAITREEFVKLAVLAFDIKSKGEKAEFEDLSDDDWCREYIDIAVSNGIINGIGGKLFGKGLNITREDMAVIICRAIQAEPDNRTPDFLDADTISEYAAHSIAKMQMLGIINGSGGYFMPKNNATRAEAVQIVYNAVQTKEE